MTKIEIKELFQRRIMSKKFHWFQYHFGQDNHVLAEAIISCCEKIEKRINGFTDNFSNRMASLSDKDRHIPHYEQLIQLLSEILVINHLFNVFPHDAQFILEPTIKKMVKILK